MRAEAPAGGQNRPPAEPAAGHAGASLRPTARVRPTVTVTLGEERPGGFPPSHAYVRRFWVAAVGPSALADLLRLVRAAEKGEEVRLPRSLPILLRHDLAWVEHGSIVVAPTLPHVPQELRWRFPPSLAAEHAGQLDPVASP